MLGSHFIIKALKQEGVNYLFMVPGGLIDPFYPHLFNEDSPIPIVAAHEGGAVYMADGYARASGKFGASLVIGGPGLTNAVTALAAAYVDRSPLFVMSGEVPTSWEGRGGFQDASAATFNDVEVVERVTLFSEAVENPALLKHHLQAALSKMFGRNNGPVHLSLPVDIQKAEIKETYSAFLHQCNNQHPFDPKRISDFWRLLVPTDSEEGVLKKIAILAGEGVVASGGAKELQEFAEAYQIPVASTLRAKGVLSEDHPLSLGIFGYAGTRHAIDALLSSNLEALIVLGSGLNQRDTLFWNKRMQPSKALIQVDKEESSISTTLLVDLPILGDCKGVLQHLLKDNSKGELLKKSNSFRTQWLKQIREKPRLYDTDSQINTSVPLHPAFIITELRRSLPRNTILLVDSGSHRAFCGHYWQSFGVREYLSATNLGPMGWAIPAAIGAKLARPEAICAVVTGDGCMQMHGLEVQTAARYNLPILFIVMNNSALGNVYLRAKEMGEKPAELTKIPTHDWAGFARSLGAAGITVRNADEISGAFSKALSNQNGPTVIDVHCGRDFPTPVSPYQESAHEWHLD
jgi:acetolactate synthase I/II/III large subunit